MKKKYTLFLVCTFAILAENSYGQIDIQALNASYFQNFDSLASAGTTNTNLPHGWLFLESGTNANTTYTAGTGSSSTGNTYSFGNTGETDRALGGLLSGSLIPTVGAGFINTSGAIITSVQISYRGERWRSGGTAREDRLDFQFSTTATSLSTGTWTDVPALNYSPPISSGATGAVNGNDSANYSTITSVIAGLNIPAGYPFYIRWTDFNASGADDGLAIDDFILIPHGISSDQPTITLAPAQLNFGDINLGDADTLSYSVTAANLTGSINIASNNPAFTLSSDRNAFALSATLPDSGGIVYVKFAPLKNGTVSASVAHSSAGTLMSLPVNGSGFDQVASIVPISAARLSTPGTKVTVAGRITVANELGNPGYIQDSSGGIPVFDPDLTRAVSIGDSVIITGPIGVFNEQKQISGTGVIFTKINTPSRSLLPEEVDITSLAAHEGELVKLKGVSVVNPTFVFYPNSTETIQRDSIVVDLRIDGNTDIAGLEKPVDTIDVTGVVGRFRERVQLLPRFSSDIPGLLEPIPATDSIPATATLDLVNWNLEFFGARREDYPQEYGPVNEGLQLDNVKKVMQSLHADIFAVQEISNDSLFAALVSQLEGYDFRCSDRFSYSFEGPDDTFPPQKVCFIFDTSVVDVLSARPLFASRYDSARSVNQDLLPGYPSGDASSFYSSGRLPFALTLNATVDGVTETITLINIHAKSGAAADDRNRRLYDATVLKDSLESHLAGKPFIVLGDLNDDLDQSITTGQPSPYVAFVNDTTRYAAVTKALSDAGARSTISFQDVIDHQIVSTILYKEYVASSAQVITPFRLIPNYATTTTDHLAVKTRFRFVKPNPPAIRFTRQNSTVSEKAALHTIAVESPEISATPMTITVSVNGDAVYGKDYVTQPTASGGTIQLILPAGTSRTSFSIQVLNDREDELEETARFTLSGMAGDNTSQLNKFELHIQDDDTPIIAFAEIFKTAKEGSGEREVKLKLSVPPVSGQQIVIGIASDQHATYGVDYTTSPPIVNNKITLDVPPGSHNVSFAVTPLNDNTREFPEIIPFYIASVSDGLLSGIPQLSGFTILDARRLAQFVVYPNPTSENITLEAPDVDGDEIISIELRSQIGEVLLSGSGALRSINRILEGKIQNAPTGIYILTLRRGEDLSLLRIVKN